MSEILYKGIASALKIDAEELIAKLKTDGGEWLPESEISKRLVSELTTAATAATEAAAEIARRKGQSEETNRLKRLVKSAGFDNPDKLIGDELFEAFTAWKDEQKGDTPPADGIEKLSKDDLAKLPIVKSLIVEAVQAGGQKFEALKKEYDAKQAEFEQFKEGIASKTIHEKGLERFRAAAKKSGIILEPDGTNVDPDVRLEMAYEYFVKREKIGLIDGRLAILDNDGEIKTDPAFGKPVDFDEVAATYAEKGLGSSTQNKNHSGSGIQQSSNGKSAGYTPSIRFDNQDHYNTYVMNEADPAKRAEAAKSWQHQQSKAAGN